MSPYELLLSATLRIEWLRGEDIPAPSDIEIPRLFPDYPQRCVLVAKGERITPSVLTELNTCWDQLAYNYYN